jgi:hypothetical protein
LALLVAGGGCAGKKSGTSTATPPSDAGADQAPVAAEPDAGTPASGAPDAGPTGPIRIGDWTYYGTSEGLSQDVRDVSLDEGGNVYVAGVDALYAKGRGDDRFLRFDSSNGGLSRKCNDAAQIGVVPTTPFFQCDVVAVAGGAPGQAFVGFDGLPTTSAEADWVQNTGGMDVVVFDAAQGTLTRTRHVQIAAPPHVVCDCGPDGSHTQWVDTCDPAQCAPNDPMPWWNYGRRYFRRVGRIAVNHDGPNPLMKGDVWVGGMHGTMAVLLHAASDRGWRDPLATLTDPWQQQEWADTLDVWEHLHPNLDIVLPSGSNWIYLGEGYAMSINPLDGMPWASNGVRTTSVGGYGPNVSFRQWWMTAFGGEPIDLWPDGTGNDPVNGPLNDNVRALTHCADGTLWAGSLTHGLASFSPSGVRSDLHLFDDAAQDGAGVRALACDRSDGSLWIGLDHGGVVRLKAGQFEKIVVGGAPAFAGQRVMDIQIDRWSSGPRVVYFAFGTGKDPQGNSTPGGVAAYDGP